MDYVITGNVIRGDGYGRKLGFPTVNLNLDKNQIIPPEGVYAGTATIVLNTECLTFKAGIVSGPHDKIEAHLIGYKGNAYGQIVTLKMEKFLRGYKKFNTEEELIKQIKKDLKKLAPY